MPKATDTKSGAAAYAAGIINDFFDAFSLSTAVTLADGIIATAGKNRYWKKGPPHTVLFFTEQLGQLVTAAFVLHNSGAVSKTAVIKQGKDAVPDMALTANFVSRYRNATVWNNFPRYLTATQYHNPYKAIQKFCGCMGQPQWQAVLTSCSEYALSSDSIAEIYPLTHVLTLRLRLLQCIEACHLIQVRG